MRRLLSPSGATSSTCLTASPSAPATPDPTTSVNPLEKLRGNWMVTLGLECLMVVVILVEGVIIGNNITGVKVTSYYWFWAVIIGGAIIVLRDWIARRQTPDFIHKSGMAMVIVGAIMCFACSFYGGYSGKPGQAVDYTVNQAGQDFHKWQDKKPPVPVKTTQGQDTRIYGPGTHRFHLAAGQETEWIMFPEGRDNSAEFASERGSEYVRVLENNTIIGQKENNHSTRAKFKLRAIKDSQIEMVVH